jgi:hypothetical protein
MAKDKKLKVSKNKVVEDQVVTQSQSTSSTTEKKTKGTFSHSQIINYLDLF